MSDPTVPTIGGIVASLLSLGLAVWTTLARRDDAREQAARAEQAEKEKEARMAAQKEAEEERATVLRRLADLEGKSSKHDTALAVLDERHDHLDRKIDGIDGKLDKVLDAVLQGRPRRETR